MSGRFPGAANLDEYRKNLKEGRECISFFTVDELLEAGIDPAVSAHPNYIKACGCLAGKAFFDAHFFGYAPLDAEYMDLQIRIFHQEVYIMLEAGKFPGGNPDLALISGTRFVTSLCL